MSVPYISFIFYGLAFFSMDGLGLLSDLCTKAFHKSKRAQAIAHARHHSTVAAI
jgi:hypothetical protein